MSETAQTVEHRVERLFKVDDVLDTQVSKIGRSVFSPENKEQMDLLKTVLLDQGNSFMTRLEAASMLVCNLPDDETLSEAAMLVHTRAKSIEKYDDINQNSRGINSKEEISLWDNLLVGLEYHGQLTDQVLGAYVTTFPVNGRESTPEHAKAVLLHTLMSIVLLQPKRNPIYKGMTSTEVAIHLDNICSSMTEKFSDVFNLDQSIVTTELHEMLKKAYPAHKTKKVVGYAGQLSLF